MRKKKDKQKPEKDAKGKKPGRLKKVLLIFIPLVMLLSGGAAAAMLGMVKIPGFKPPFSKSAAVAKSAKGKEKTAKADAAKKAPKPAPKPTPPVTPPAVAVASKPKAPTTDPQQGVKKVAKLWNELEAEKLMPIVADWKDGELARVLARMESDKVAQLLATLPPKRASALSRAIQVEASKLAKPPTT